MAFNMIACVDNNWGIGDNGNLLFHLPEDMRYFEKKTKESGVVIMGRKTFESIRSPLPNRLNFILTRNLQYVRLMSEKFDHEQIKVFPCTTDLLKYIDKNNIKSHRCFVIGGEEIYKEFLPFTSDCYITEVKASANKVDKYFPKKLSESNDWSLVHTEQGEECVSIGTNYYFNHYKRKDDPIW